jgi:hypothetical protein
MTVLKTLLVDLLVHLISFMVVIYVKRNTLILDAAYSNYFLLYMTTRLTAGILAKQYATNQNVNYSEMLKQRISGLLLHLGMLSVGLIKYGLIDISRSTLIFTLLISYAIEILNLVIGNLGYTSKKKTLLSFLRPNKFIVSSILLLGLTTGLLFFFQNSSLWQFAKSLSLMVSSWILSTLYVNNNNTNYSDKYIVFLYPNIRWSVFFLSITLFLIFILKYDSSNQLLFLLFITLFLIAQFISKSLFYLYNTPRQTDEIAADYLSASVHSNGLQKNNEKISSNPDEYDNIKEFHKRIKNIYLKKLPAIYSFISESIDLSSINAFKASVMRSIDPYNIQTLSSNSIEYFMNLHDLNDVRRINQYFIKLNEKMIYGGYYIGCFEPTTLRYSRFKTTYPENIAKLYYFIDFLWKRISPKLPVVQKLYFAITDGKDRALSKAEGLGRLYYCGFDLISLLEYDTKLYFIAKKQRLPKNDKNPSYSPIYRMKRVGQNGKDIYIYKFRTMHPYSEYLQDYIIEKNGYQSNGKPANDFRLTSWGKFMRKYWLDELPQLLNVIKGEMKIVGIRPVSERFLDEFTDEMKEMRLKHKPGCVPPYVSLNIQGVREFINAEEVYLLEKEKHPYKTDIIYLIKAIDSIILKKMRSS